MATDYGIKVSKPGYAVDTATDKQLAYSSKFSSFKIFASGTISVDTDGSGDGSASVTHNLGYSPTFKLFSEISGKYYPNPGAYIRRQTEGPQNMYAHSTSTELVVESFFAGADSTYKLKYYIFIDLAETYSGNGVSFANDYGIKVSKPGVDVKDAKSYELAYSSSFPSLKVYSSGQTTMYLAARNCDSSPNEEAVDATVSHSLGYPPYFLAFFKTTDAGIYINDSNDKFEIGSRYRVGALDYLIWILEERCIDTELSFEFWRWSQCVDNPLTPPVNCDGYCYNWGNETVTVYYYIFEEDITVA